MKYNSKLVYKKAENICKNYSKELNNYKLSYYNSKKIILVNGGVYS